MSRHQVMMGIYIGIEGAKAAKYRTRYNRSRGDGYREYHYCVGGTVGSYGSACIKNAGRGGGLDSDSFARKKKKS